MPGELMRMCPTVEKLPDGWRVKRLGLFCTKIGTGATPRGGNEVYLSTRVSHALVRSQHVFDRHFESAGLAFISASHAKELRNAEVQSGDVLLNITGDGVTFGRSCIVPDRILPACFNQHVSIIRPDHRECDPGYLLSVLTHPAAKSYIEAFNSGGSRRAITKGHIESFEIPLPPLAQQRAIAAALGALDDKIEANRQINETLEALAQTFFKNWFVDAAATKLPKGWREVPLPEAIEVNPPRSLRKGEVAPYLDMANMPTNSGRALDVSNREFGSGMRFMDGDTLVARITPCLENGKTCFVDFLGEGKIGWGSTEYIVLRPKPPLPDEFAYFLARTESFRAFAISNMTGTTGRQRVPADCLKNFPVFVPSAELAKKFGEPKAKVRRSGIQSAQPPLSRWTRTDTSRLPSPKPIQRHARHTPM